MQQGDLVKFKLPDAPGVYRFLDEKGKVLYIGKATSLRDRVRSYFANDLLHTRGKRIVDMVTLAQGLKWTKTDSVLDALVLEAGLIKNIQPKYNIDEKDDKSWNYVVITKEEFPKVLLLRERAIHLDERAEGGEWLYTFGPFPYGGQLAEALKIIRKIFPYRDEKCRPELGRPCFNRQIGLCPGVCTGEVSAREYGKTIKRIAFVFSGKKSMLERSLRKEMGDVAKKQEFEKARELRDALFALSHIKDASLITEETRAVLRRVAQTRRRAFRIEAYDVAHIFGQFTVGVMTVIEDGKPKKSDYRKFKLRISPNRSDDTLHLREILRRRFGHKEWATPDLIVVDGGVAQKKTAERVIAEFSLATPAVGVVKDRRHRPKNIIGKGEFVESFRRGILIANAEAHRFAVEYHRKLREKLN